MGSESTNVREENQEDWANDPVIGSHVRALREFVADAPEADDFVNRMKVIHGVLSSELSDEDRQHIIDGVEAVQPPSSNTEGQSVE